MNLPDVYLSGGFDLNYKLEKQMLKRSGCKFRCFSAAFILPENPHYSKRMAECQKACEDNNVKIMLDSGAFSLHSLRELLAKNMKVSAKEKANVMLLVDNMYNRYIDYIKLKLAEKKLEFYITLDFVKSQPYIYAMQKRFMKDGLRPAPVFHGDETCDWLKKYADLGIKFVCIGTIPGRRADRRRRFYLDHVFNAGEKLGMKFHGLALTRLDFMLNYPFVSVDSSTWTQTASYGMIAMPSSKKKLVFVHISTRSRESGKSRGYAGIPKSTLKEMADYVDKFGFNLKKMSTSTIEREIWNAQVFSNIEQHFDVQDNRDKYLVGWENML